MTMSLASIVPQMTVADLLNTWPAAVPVFIHRQMACVGCSMSRFETLSDAARIYGQDLESLLSEIKFVSGESTHD